MSRTKFDEKASRELFGDAFYNALKSAVSQNSNRKDAHYALYVHIVHPEFPKYYVGITARKPEVRWGHLGYKYRNIHFSNAIRKYGWDNILHVVITEKLTKEQAFFFEREAIRTLKSNDRDHGYNISSGGDGGNRKPTKRVYQYSLDGEYIQSYESAAEAARIYHCDRTNITHACKTNGATHGFQWRYSLYMRCEPYTWHKMSSWEKNLKCRH